MSDNGENHNTPEITTMIDEKGNLRVNIIITPTFVQQAAKERMKVNLTEDEARALITLHARRWHGQILSNLESDVEGFVENVYDPEERS